MCVGSYNAGDTQDCHPCTGFVIFLNMSMIDWVTKKQATVEGAVLVLNLLL